MLDISFPDCATEEAERQSVNREMRCMAIAEQVGEPSLPTRRLQWNDLFVSGDPPGAMTPTVARETLTTAANRRRWERQKRLRGGIAGLLNSIAPRPLGRGVRVSAPDAA
jgi:hypothetical protein